MKRLVFTLVATAIVAGAGLAAAQSTPSQPAAVPQPMRYGGLSGLWTMPQGDFQNGAEDGWGILIMGEQFLNPTRMVAVTSDFGYLDFGSKKVGSTTLDTNMFPFQAGIRVYPLMQKKPDSKAQIFGEGSLGFITTRSEIQNAFGSTNNYDYYFGTGAGFGVKLNAGPTTALLFDATWNWVYATDTASYLALRGAIMVGR